MPRHPKRTPELTRLMLTSVSFHLNCKPPPVTWEPCTADVTFTEQSGDSSQESVALMSPLFAATGNGSGLLSVVRLPPRQAPQPLRQNTPTLAPCGWVLVT